MRYFLVLFLLLASVGAYSQSIGVAKSVVMGSHNIPLPPQIVFTNDLTTSPIDANFTVTRSSTGWAYDTGGSIVSYATNIQRRPASPRGTSLNAGLGVDLVRTNLFLNSTAPVTQTVTLTGIGTKVAWITGNGSLTLSGAASCVVTEAAPCTFYNASAGVSLTSTAAGTVTFAQIEQCSTANVANCAPSAPIVTAGANVTRQADIVNTTNIASLGIPVAAASYVIDFYVPAKNNLNQVLMSLSNCAVTTQLRVAYQPANNFVGFVPYNSGAPGAGANSTAVSTGQINRVAVAYDATGVSIAVNGTPAASRAFSNTFVPSCLNIGSDGAGGNQTTGFISKIVAYDGRLNTTALQVASAIPVPTPAGGFKWVGDTGQSLTVGVQALVDTTTPPVPTCGLMPDDIFGTRGAQSFNTALVGAVTTGYVPAFEAFYAPPPYDPANYGETQVTAKLVQLCSYATGETYIGRSGGAGGRTLALLSQGSGPYNNTIADLTTAVGLSGNNVTDIGHGFAQGESDRAASTSIAAYRAQGIRLFLDFNTDIKALTSQTSDVIFYIMQLAKTASGGGSNDYSQVQLEWQLGSVGQTSPYARVCGPQYIYPKAAQGKPTGDGTHNSALGYKWMGEQEARCLQYEYGGTGTWYPLYATAIAFDAVDKSIINVTFNKTVSVLPPGQGVAANNGFEFIDDCLSEKISSVTLGASSAVIQLTGIPSCANPTLQNAWDGPTKLTDTALPTLQSGGSGYTNGTCSVSVSYNTANAYSLATLNVTVVAGAVTSIDSVTFLGLYPKTDNGTHGGVPLTGCGGSGAAAGIILTAGFTSNYWSAAWSDIAHASGVVGATTGEALDDYLVIFSLPVSP